MMVNRGLGSPSQCGGPDRLLMSPSGRLEPLTSRHCGRSQTGGFLTFESDLIIQALD